MSGMHADSAAFVRDSMLPQKAPPVTEAGAVKWVRENLFSGWFNTTLTILGILAIYWIFSHAWPWFRHGVWVAETIQDCRRIVTERWGEGATGACWAVLRERWTQFVFGFYPNDLYWRPVLAFALLFVAIAPVLFNGLPRKMLWFTLAFPFIAVFLLWGGSVWSILSIIAVFGVAWLAYSVLTPVNGALGIAGAVVLALAYWVFLSGAVADQLQSIIPLGLEPVRSDKFGGFVLSIVIGVACITLSLPFGIVLALGRQSDMFLVKYLSVCFIEFIRGVPLITLLFTASLLLNYFLPPGTNFDIILRVIIMVTLFASAYIAEVIRGGLAALPRGQYEAANALGLDYGLAQRFIILPQALKISIPGIVSSFIGLFKDTTLVVFVGLLDPLKGITDAVRASTDWKGIYWEPYIFVGFLFFLMCFGMSRYSMYLERKLKTDHR